VTPRERSRFRILITDVHELAGLAAARSLGRAGYTVIGAAPVAQLASPGTGSRYLTDVVATPSGDNSFAELRDWLRHYCSAHEVHGVLPTAASTQLAAAQLMDRAQIRCPVIGIAPQGALTNSAYLSARAAQTLGMSIPPTWYVYDGTQRDATQLRRVRLPCRLRSDATLSPRGEYVPARSWEAATAADCAAVVDECASLGARLIAQELSPGRDVTALCVRWRNEVAFRAAESPSALAAADAFLRGVAHEGVALLQYRVPDTGPIQLTSVTSSLAAALAKDPGGALATVVADLALAGSASMNPTVAHLDGRRADGYFRWSDPVPGLRWAGRRCSELGRRSADAVSRLLSASPRRMLALTARPEQIRGARKILLLCRGNLCRSPFAAALLAKRIAETGGGPIDVRSAGFDAPVGEQAPERFTQLLERFGVSLAAHCARSVSAADVAAADLIVIMDFVNLADMYRRFRAALPKTLLLGALDRDEAEVELADPVAAPAPVAATIYQRLATCVDALAAQVRD
jgi:protein-tyrosine-phosphatase